MAVPIELARIIRKLDLQAFADQGREKARALCRILCSNNFSETWSPSREAEPSLVDAERLLREILSRSAEDLAAGLEVTADNEKFLFSVPWYCHGRRLFTRVDGTPGLASRAARPGDKVVIWLGCANAMILRPVQDARYQIVGEAYCGEVMEGETLLGHLPESFEHKTRLDERDNHFYRGYYDQRSGHFQVEDPRLTHLQLPPGWRRQRHENEDFVEWLVNNEIGEGVKERDPRPIVEVLKSRGVNLEEFELV